MLKILAGCNEVINMESKTWQMIKSQDEGGKQQPETEKQVQTYSGSDAQQPRRPESKARNL